MPRWTFQQKSHSTSLLMRKEEEDGSFSPKSPVPKMLFRKKGSYKNLLVDLDDTCQRNGKKNNDDISKHIGEIPKPVIPLDSKLASKQIMYRNGVVVSAHDQPLRRVDVRFDDSRRSKAVPAKISCQDDWKFPDWSDIFENKENLLLLLEATSSKYQRKEKLTRQLSIKSVTVSSISKRQKHQACPNGLDHTCHKTSHIVKTKPQKKSIQRHSKKIPPLPRQGSVKSLGPRSVTSKSPSIKSPKNLKRQESAPNLVKSKPLIVSPKKQVKGCCEEPRVNWNRIQAFPGTTGKSKNSSPQSIKNRAEHDPRQKFVKSVSFRSVHMSDSPKKSDKSSSRGNPMNRRTSFYKSHSTGELDCHTLDTASKFAATFKVASHEMLPALVPCSAALYWPGAQAAKMSIET